MEPLLRPSGAFEDSIPRVARDDAGNAERRASGPPGARRHPAWDDSPQSGSTREGAYPSMELVNQTAVPALAVVASGEEDGPRIGMLVAKATFTLAGGVCRLDTDDPLPLFEEDEETEVGLLPADVRPRPQSTPFEVILVGSAQALHEQPVAALTVGLTVGSVSKTMAVFGDRWWTADGQMTQPRPFTSMPLTWDRAFGGSCDVWLDDSTVVEARDPMNFLGRGFDGSYAAARLADAMGAAPGYPRVEYEWRLPNVERSEALIRTPRDRPDPVCWSPAPPGVGFSQVQLIREIQEAEDPVQAEPSGASLMLRASPDWRIPLPEAGAPVVLDGCDPEGRLAFELPRLRVLADYVLGDRQGQRELAPQLLTVLPDQRRVCITYRSHFTAEVEEGMERSFRLRLEDGWYSPTQTASERR